MAATVVAVITKDAMKPYGITRRVFRSLGNRIAARLREPEADAKRTIRTVEAEVLPGPRESK